MKILLATGLFPPQIGGPATYAKLLYDELPKRGIDVEVAAFGDYLDKPKLIRHFLYFRELLRKAPDADVIYALDPVSVGLPALFASQVRDKKFVLRIAGDYAWEQGSQRWKVSDTLDEFVMQHEKYSWQVRLLKKIQKYVADAAHLIITPSEYFKSIIGAWGIKNEKITVAYGFYDVSSTKTLKATLKKRLNCLGPTITASASHASAGDIASLLQAFEKISEEYVDPRLVVFCQKHKKSEIEAQSSQSKFSQQIEIVSSFGDQEHLDYIKASEAFISFAPYGKAPHEIHVTMLVGTPIITVDAGMDRKIIQHGKTCIIIDQRDPNSLLQAIRELISERAIAFMISKTAKKTLLDHGKDEMIRSAAEVFRNL